MKRLRHLILGHVHGPSDDDRRAMDPTGGRTADQAEHASLLRRATYASVSVASILIVLKLGAWLQTESVSMLSALVDSMLDLVASLVTLFAVRHALSPADREHRFGHGKAEALAGLGQATFVAGSSTLLMIEAARRLIHPAQVQQPELGIAVMVVAIVLTLGLVLLQRRVVQRTGSVAIASDSLHYAGDLLTNIAVIVSLLLTASLGWTLVDPLFGGAIGLFLLFNAWLIGRRALAVLMDQELPDEARAQILAIAKSHAGVSDVHELKTRESGPNRFIQFHLEMDGAMSLRRAHEISDEVEAALLVTFPDAEIIIHQDPEGLDEGHPSLDN
ncbi:MAG: cation diffusion facilitator family transporter [Alphaproteobacteria bacterium]|nr:cation diffusion facilitator family transporter [Alphaproteobacteria bacterium]